MIAGLINEEDKTKQSGVKPEKFESEPEYKDLKRANESADNDMDRVAPNNIYDDAKKATDEAYMKDQSGKGTSPSSSR
ncbi:hypothetical protein BH10BAC3_BH10BAC3_07700 [soil metagenome]